MKNILITTVLTLVFSINAFGFQDNPVVVIQTGFGVIEVELFDKKAPVTVGNFLAYVDSGLYENSRFHRVVTHDNDPRQPDIKINVIQAGLGRDKARSGFPPIEHETTDKTGVLHKNGIISMARNRPGSARADFFICINDQPSLDFGGLRNKDGQGFAAFGIVIKGMDVVKKIYGQPHEGQSLNPPVIILNIGRKRNLH